MVARNGVLRKLLVFSHLTEAVCIRELVNVVPFERNIELVSKSDKSSFEIGVGALTCCFYLLRVLKGLEDMIKAVVIDYGLVQGAQNFALVICDYLKPFLSKRSFELFKA